MATLKTVYRFVLVSGFASALFACNNPTETAKEESKKTADTTATPAVPPPVVFKPFDMAEMTHTIKDYAVWRPVYDADSVSRKAVGLNNIVEGRSIENKNKVFMAWVMTDIQKAKAFSVDPALKEKMGKAGVTSKPEIKYLHVIRFTPEVSIKEWVIINHRVKDFDAWVKVFDGEGKEKRLSEGMVDAVLARGIDDPNFVQVVFDITDMTKAKAALLSEDKKKLMTNAGVEGKPDIQFYTTAE